MFSLSQFFEIQNLVHFGSFDSFHVESSLLSQKQKHTHKATARFSLNNHTNTVLNAKSGLFDVSSANFQESTPKNNSNDSNNEICCSTASCLKAR